MNPWQYASPTHIQPPTPPGPGPGRKTTGTDAPIGTTTTSPTRIRTGPSPTCPAARDEAPAADVPLQDALDHVNVGRLVAKDAVVDHVLRVAAEPDINTPS